MAERVPDTDPTLEPIIQDIAVYHQRAEARQPVIGPALAAFYSELSGHKVYSKVGENVRARMRPGLAMRVIRDAVTRRGERIGDPLIAPYFDEDEVKRNIGQLQTNYGPVPSGNREKDRNRSMVITARMAKAGLYDERSQSGLPPIHELNAAYTLYEQSIVAEDKATQDSVELLLAAYGMSIDNLQHQELR